MKYDFNIRYQNPSWSFCHVSALIELAEKHRNSSFIIYAALECRNNIERIELEILLAASESVDSEWVEILKGKNGIQKFNDKFNGLKFRYQTFTESFTSAILDDCSLKFFDFKNARDFQNKLSQYIHIYYRSNEELLYDSSFIQDGLILINEAIQFTKSNMLFIDNGYVLGSLKFSSLSDSMKALFNDWLNEFATDTNVLVKKLIELNKRENNGEKLKVSFK